MGDYISNEPKKPQRFYAYFTANSSELAAASPVNSVTSYIKPFLQMIRSDRIRISLKSLSVVIESTSATPAAFAQTAKLIIKDKNPMNMAADIPEKALLLTVSLGGRSGQVNHYQFQSSASDEVSISLCKADVDGDGRLITQLTDIVSYGGASTADTLLHMQGILEITEDFVDY